MAYLISQLRIRFWQNLLRHKTCPHFKPRRTNPDLEFSPLTTLPVSTKIGHLRNNSQYESPILCQLLDLISPAKINISDPRFEWYDPWDMANRKSVPGFLPFELHKVGIFWNLHQPLGWWKLGDRGGNPSKNL